MSANEGDMITLKPKSFNAQTACSLEEPQPKFSFVTKFVNHDILNHLK